MNERAESQHLVIDVATCFSKYPIGRTCGEFSGKRFRLEHLTPAMASDAETITVDFSDCYGWPGGSFLDEAFVGLAFWEKLDVQSAQRLILIGAGPDQTALDDMLDTIATQTVGHRGAVDTGETKQ